MPLDLKKRVGRVCTMKNQAGVKNGKELAVLVTDSVTCRKSVRAC